MLRHHRPPLTGSADGSRGGQAKGDHPGRQRRRPLHESEGGGRARRISVPESGQGSGVACSVPESGQDATRKGGRKAATLLQRTVEDKAEAACFTDVLSSRAAGMAARGAAVASRAAARRPAVRSILAAEKGKKGEGGQSCHQLQMTRGEQCQLEVMRKVPLGLAPRFSREGSMVPPLPPHRLMRA